MNNRCLSILVGGASSGTGKTWLIEKIIMELSSYTITAIKSSISEEHTQSLVLHGDSIREKGKDTARIAAAGARNVILIKSSRDNLQKSIKKAFELVPEECEILICEGNSLNEYVHFDLLLYLENKKSNKTLKESAARFKQKADMCIEHMENESDKIMKIIKERLHERKSHTEST